MTPWNTLPDSYQQRVYNNTLATVNLQIQQAENPTPAVVIGVEAARVNNVILHDYLTFEVALDDPEIGSTEQNIPIGNNCTDDELHFSMPEGSRIFEDKCDESDAIHSASRRRWAATELERFDLGTIDTDGYECKDDDDADADEEEDASQADNGSTQNVEGRGPSTRECEDWTVYFIIVKYDNCEANAKASDVSEAKHVL